MAHILIIDDDLQILKLHKTFLELEGHTVSTAPDGKVGMKLLAENQFELVVTDIIMPERDGLEVLISQLRAPNRPKIIAITGGSPSNDQNYLLNMAKKLKADMVFSKPLDLRELSTAINSLLVA